MHALFDLILSSALIGGLLALAGAYLLRVMFHGDARYERIERLGGSVLLGKRAMEMGYWGLQGVGKLFVQAGVTPDQITSMTLVLAAVAAVAVAGGHFGVALVFLVAGLLGDSLDGMVARMSGRVSSAGAVFDSVMDRYVEGVYLFGLGYYYRHDPTALLLVFGALMGSFMVSYVSAKAELAKVEGLRGLMRRTERAVYTSVATALTPFAQMAAGTLDPTWKATWPMLTALGLIAVVANLSAAHRLLMLVRALRQRDSEAAAQQAAEERPSPLPAPAVALVAPAAAPLSSGLGAPVAPLSSRLSAPAPLSSRLSAPVAVARSSQPVSSRGRTA